MTELLVVLGVIVVLVAILLPALASTGRSARETACAAGLREKARVLLARSAENGGYLPLVGWVDLPAGLGQYDRLPPVLGDEGQRRYAYFSGGMFDGLGLAPPQAAVATFLREEGDDGVTGRWDAGERVTRLFTCPSVPAEARTGVSELTTYRVGGDRRVFLHKLPADYAWNGGLMGFHYDRRYDSVRRRGAVVRVGEASSTLLFADAVPGSQPMAWAPELRATAGGVSLREGLGLAMAPKLDPDRHGGRANVTYADGHVAASPATDDAMENVALVGR